MILRYKIKTFRLKETTKDRGIVRYVLVEGQGSTREVSAIAVLGGNSISSLHSTHRIKSIHAIHKREKPLIDVLAKSSVGDIIEVDFSAYNNNHPRGSKTMYAKSTKVVDPYQESLITDIHSLKHHKSRILKLVGLSALVLTAFIFAKDSFF